MKKLNLLLTALVLALPAGAKSTTPNVLDLKESITDKAIVYPETFEQNTQKMLESWYMKNYTTTDDRYASEGDPATSDETIKKRLKAMPTVIEMPFNQIVRSYIDRYTSRSRAQVAVLLGLSNYYTPIFEQALEEKGLPLELKYLPVIESGLNPNAVSRHGAAGLWQLMLGTGKGLGLEVNSLVDERRDPYLSSEKAAGYLKDLYATYGDWTLAIAAYNCGPGTVNKALRRAGGDATDLDFWAIYKYLPEETRGYVPMFIAANYVMTYYKDHNISPVLATKPLVTDTVAVNSRLHFNQISEVLNLPVEELRILNPQFRKDLIPAGEGRSYFLILPSQQIHAYLLSEDDILAHDAIKYEQRETAEPGVAASSEPVINSDLTAETTEPETTEADEKAQEEVAMVKAASAQKESQKGGATRTKTITHKVAAGETLASIARDYNVSQDDIKSWNSLRRNAVRTGQQLKILVPDDTASAGGDSASASSKAAAKASTKGTASKTAKTDNDTDNSAVKSGSKSKAEKAAKDDNASKKSSKKAKKSKKNSKASKKKTPKSTTHTVTSGENLERIAKRNGVTVDELRKANPKLKGDMIHPGDKLNVPAKDSKSGKKSGKKKRKR